MMERRVFTALTVIRQNQLTITRESWTAAGIWAAQGVFGAVNGWKKRILLKPAEHVSMKEKVMLILITVILTAQPVKTA